MKNIVFIFLATFCYITGYTQQKDRITDPRDNIVYQTIKVNNEWWLAENLKYIVPDSSYCYDSLPQNCSLYGRLYNWTIAKKVCPEGWQLPSKTEYESLINYLNLEGNSAYYQLIPNGESDFNALFGGGLFNNNTFLDLEETGYFWSSSDTLNSAAYALRVDSYFEDAYMDKNAETSDFSVRCIKNK